jgi:hypothetical protein
MTQHTQLQPVYPLPELIDGQAPWNIQDDRRQPRVDLIGRNLFVPLVNDPQWRNIRHHELAHITFTPRWSVKRINAEGASNLMMQAVEDMRVNYLARRSGVDLSLGCPDAIIKQSAIAIGDDRRNITGFLMADLALPARLDSQTGQALLNTVPSDKTPAEWATYVRQCNDIASLALDYLLCSTKAHRLHDVCPKFSRRGKPLSFKRTFMVARWLDRLFEKDDPMLSDCNNKAQGEEALKDAAVKWGTLREVKTPRLSIPKALRRLPRLAEEGSCLKAPWRVTSDGRVFGERRARKHGTVLIDGSGSMSLGPDLIQEMVRRIPCGTVAAYEGDKPDSGYITILGRNGKIAADLAAYHLGGGNIIDGPALEWLAAQEGPRYWICDGQVTGIGDRSDPVLSDIAMGFSRAHGIKRFPFAQLLDEYLKTNRYHDPDRYEP